MPVRPPRRGSLRARAELSFAAFAPAFGLMTWRAWDSPLALIYGSAAFLGMVVVLAVFWAARTGNPEPLAFGDVADSSSDILGHVSTYLVAAIVDPKVSTSEAVLGLTVFALILLIHISAGLVHVNPLFYVLGYRVYTGTTVNDHTYYLVVKTEVADWEGVQRFVRIPGDILIERSNDASE